jgi:NAD(P)-dependent dehydrogenase (short-subunit alcohol dehydrogenase family)
MIGVTMKEFKGKVAVVTGAASGIGHEISRRCAVEGMNLVLADVDRDGLERVKSELEGKGATVLTVPTDVSKAGDVEALARETLDAFGGVHLLFNNAGVITTGTVWGDTLKDWERVMGVNLWGVIHGVRTFVPIMLAQDEEGVIVNTSSMRGFSRDRENGAYGVTKHGVTALSETLYYELAEKSDKVKVALLCPGPVDTPIIATAESRITERRASEGEKELAQDEAAMFQRLQQKTRTGMSPEEIAEKAFQGIMEDKFYIITQPGEMPRVRRRMEAILEERNPTLPP